MEVDNEAVVITAPQLDGSLVMTYGTVMLYMEKLSMNEPVPLVRTRISESQYISLVGPPPTMVIWPVKAAPLTTLKAIPWGRNTYPTCTARAQTALSSLAGTAPAGPPTAP